MIPPQRTPDRTGSAAPPPPDGSLQRLHLWQIQPVRDALSIATVVAIIMLGYWLRPVTVPLLIALGLAYLMEPIVARLSSSRHLSRPFVVGGLVLILITTVIVAAGALVPAIVVQTIDLFKAAPENLRRLLAFIQEKLPDELRAQVVGPDGQLGTPVVEWVRANLGSIAQLTVARTGDALGLIIHIIGSTLYAAFLLFLIPFYFYFFSTQWARVGEFVRQTVPPAQNPRFYELTGKMDRAISGFVRGRLVISVIVGVMLAVGWGICGVPYFLVVGLLTGIFFLVPYLGGVGVPIAIVLLWLGQGDVPEADRMVWWAVIAWPLLVFLIIQVVETYILTPIIAGRTTNLGPVSIIVAVLAGGIVMGVYGMILAIPAMACLKILGTEVFMPRVREWASGRARDILPIDES